MSKSIFVKIISYIVVSLLTAAIVLFLINREMSSINLDSAQNELVHVASGVEKDVNNLCSRLLTELAGFCLTVANDRDFAMKLLVEQDYTAPEIADIAGRYIDAMGFSFLEITDANYRILSSGHFPASAGNRSNNKSQFSDSLITFFFDNIKGEQVLSIQVKIPFSCAGFKLYCTGGIKADSNFVSQLKPHKDVQVFLKHGNNIIGKDNIETISEIKNNKVIINNTTFLAVSLPLLWVGENERPEIIILIDEPMDFTLLDLFS